MNIARVLRKLLHGESIVTVTQPQAHWDKQFMRGKWRHSEELGQNVGAVLRNVLELSLTRPIRVLDVGCGSGVLGQYLTQANANISYVGTDISVEALKQAEQRVPRGTFVHSSMADNPHLDGTFDVIVFAEVLLYADFHKTLAIHKQYLKDDGILLISLYQTLRTRYIWQRLKRSVNVLKDISLRDNLRRISWRIWVCTYR